MAKEKKHKENDRADAPESDREYRYELEGEGDMAFERNGISDRIEEGADALRAQGEAWMDKGKQAASSAASSARDKGEQAAQKAMEFAQENPRLQQSLEQIDLATVKRWAAIVAGSVLALMGLRRAARPLLVAGLGGALVYWGLKGRWPYDEDMRGAVQSFGKQTGLSFSPASIDFGGRRSGQDPIVRNILVRAPVREVYQAWANFENFPQFMQNIKSVTKTGDKTSHWVMQGPLNTTFEWDADTTRMDENKRIAWNSRDGGDLITSGQVTFNALPDGAVEVTVMLKYAPPAGVAGEVVAKLFADPEARLMEDLKNFKRFVEQGGAAAETGSLYDAGSFDASPGGEI